MKIVAITGPRQCAIVEKPAPHAHENIVVVKIHVAPLCTECKDYQRGGVSECLGHEAAGEVVEVAQPGSVKVGDRVLFTKYGGTEVKVDGDEVLVLREEDIMGVLDK